MSNMREIFDDLNNSTEGVVIYVDDDKKEIVIESVHEGGHSVMTTRVPFSVFEPIFRS